MRSRPWCAFGMAVVFKFFRLADAFRLHCDAAPRISIAHCLSCPLAASPLPQLLLRLVRDLIAAGAPEDARSALHEAMALAGPASIANATLDSEEEALRGELGIRQ